MNIQTPPILEIAEFAPTARDSRESCNSRSTGAYKSCAAYKYGAKLQVSTGRNCARARQPKRCARTTRGAGSGIHGAPDQGANREGASACTSGAFAATNRGAATSYREWVSASESKAVARTSVRRCC